MIRGSVFGRGDWCILHTRARESTGFRPDGRFGSELRCDAFLSVFRALGIPHRGLGETWVEGERDSGWERERERDFAAVVLGH